jgi:hypothetical protein
MLALEAVGLFKKKARPALALHFSGSSSSNFGSVYARAGLSPGVFLGGSLLRIVVIFQDHPLSKPPEPSKLTGIEKRPLKSDFVFRDQWHRFLLFKSRWSAN